VKWCTIRVPKELKDQLDEIAKNYEAHKNDAYWRIIAKAVAHYKPSLQAGFKKKQIPRLDKAAWYAFKLASSIGALKENPTPQNLDLLKTTCQQLEDRLGLDLSLLRKAAEDFTKHPTTQNKIELNDLTKLVIADIITKFILEAQ